MDLFDVLLVHLGVNLLLWIRWRLTGTEIPFLVFLAVGVILGWSPTAFENLAVRILFTIVLGAIETIWVGKNLWWIQDHCTDHTIRPWNSPELQKYTTNE